MVVLTVEDMKMFGQFETTRNLEGLSFYEWYCAAGYAESIGAIPPSEFKVLHDSWRANMDPTEFRSIAPKRISRNQFGEVTGIHYS
jgi:hypothetical protein